LPVERASVRITAACCAGSGNLSQTARAEPD
jgi:hypothetical protein